MKIDSKTFNISLLISIPLFFMVYFSSVYFFYFDNKDDSFSVYTYFKYKDSIANQIDEKKIVFTSGSNNYLGIRAFKIEDTFDIPVVNHSIHAGLKADYIFERAKRILKEGDIVIVPLEYGNINDEGETSIVLNKFLLSYDKPYFNTHYSFKEKMKILSSISVVDLLHSILYGKRKDTIELKKELMKDINSNGDMLNKNIHDSLKTKKPPFKLPSRIGVETKGLKAIKDFNDYCTEHKILFFITYPNIVYDPVYKRRRYKSYFDFILSYFKKNNIRVLGDPYKAMYPRELFFDSEYHLISKGSDLRTADFIKILKSNKTFLKHITKESSEHK